MDKDTIVKEIFEIAMHSIRNEEIFLKQDAMQRYIKNITDIETLNATTVLTYEHDIKRAEASITQRREWLYDLMDKYFKEG